MAGDENNESEKLDFPPDGEGYISLAKARVLAMQTAVASPGDYGSQYQGVVMIFEVVESSEDDDYYTVILSLQPQGDFDGIPGQEQFVVGKQGTIAVRQVLSSPVKKSGGFPVLPVTIGLVVFGAIVSVGSVFALGSSSSPAETVKTITQVYIPLPTQTPTFPPMPTYTPYPTPSPVPTYTPRPTPTARVIVVTPTFTPRPVPTKTPRPTATPNARSYYDKAKDYEKAENWALAIGEYTKAIGMNPDYYTDAYWSRGRAYIEIGQFLLAITDYTKAIQIDPNEAGLYYGRGYIYVELQQHQNAINDYTKSIQLDPDDDGAYNNRAISYGTLGQHQNAIDDYTKAIQINSDDASYYYNRAFDYRDLGQWSLSAADEIKACSLDIEYCNY